MTRLIGVLFLTLALTAVAIPPSSADAQWVTVSRPGIQYNGYGQGYYGGYGRQYSYYAPANRSYSAYGNGAYLYGTQTALPLPNAALYGYGTRTYYDGYGYPANYGQYSGRTYRHFGYGRHDSFGNSW